VARDSVSATTETFRFHPSSEIGSQSGGKLEAFVAAAGRERSAAGGTWKDVFQQAVPRPSAPTKGKHNEVSARLWSAVHATLSGSGTAAENLELIELDLDEVKGNGW